MADLAPPRGTQDLLPDRADAVLGLYDEAHRLSRLFGYRYLETPTFEHTGLFTRTSGETSDVVTKEMYTFEDKGGRSVTLRPESTAGVMRAWLDHAQDLGAPFRGYYIANEFRHGRPQQGRLREFRQFGVEVIGVEAPGADVDVLALGERFLRERGLRDYSLHLNSIGDEVCRPAYREELIAYFEGHIDDLDEDCRARLAKNPLRVFDCKVDGGKDFVVAAPTIAERLCESCEDHFAAVRAGLDAAGIEYELDPRLVRGLDYYTRTAFEWISGALTTNKAATVNAGGRYDGLAAALGGPPTPGVGFAMGVDRVLLAMESEGSQPPPARTPQTFVVAVGPDARAAGGALVDDLRGVGVSAIAAFEERPMKAQLKQADRAGAAFAAIVGERELADGTVTLRRLSDGIQETVPAGEVSSWLTRLDDRPEYGTGST
jgi:histidyl-tRNA synthetase